MSQEKSECLYYDCKRKPLGTSKGGYCIFHERKKDKSFGEFQQKLKEQLSKEDFNFRGYFFPKSINFIKMFPEPPCIFVDTDFSKSYFCDGAIFDSCKFKGSNTSFEHATFRGKLTSFILSEFEGDTVSFDHAKFEGKITNFNGCKFMAANTHFESTDFGAENSEIHFDPIMASENSMTKTVKEIPVKFFGSETKFDSSMFLGDEISFYKAEFHARETSFGLTKFLCKKIWFDRALFTSAITEFGGSRFGKEREVTAEEAERYGLEQKIYKPPELTYKEERYLTAHPEELEKFEKNSCYRDKDLGVISFNGAKFKGVKTYFADVAAPTVFAGGITYFNGASFTGEEVGFSGVYFMSRKTFFHSAKFTKNTYFENTHFTKGEVNFNFAKFLGNITSFKEAKFRGDVAKFENSQFKAKKTRFASTDFSADYVTFKEARFEGNRVIFNGSYFRGRSARFIESRFLSEKISFISVKFPTDEDENKEVVFQEASFNENVEFRNVYLGRCTFYGSNIEKANFTSVIWPKKNMFLEEKKASKESLKRLEDVYRRIKLSYRRTGNYDLSGEFYYREMECKRKTSSFVKYLVVSIIRLFCGYGEKPEWVLYSWGITIGGCGLLYWLSRDIVFSHSDKICSPTLLDGLYFSITTFTTLGYGDWYPNPSSWIRIVSVFEALFGAFMMALLIFTFARKMLR